MRVITPDYSREFRCTADKCRHSCCIGWEIDIDPDTREKYRRIPGAFGQRLNESIDDGEVSTFRLGAGERCPMLNANGLCDLITELGEEHLCQICADHPRFRNYFTDHVEMGLGLCCEEAARLILTRKIPMQLIVLEDDGAEEPSDGYEVALLAEREVLLRVLRDESIPLEERLEELLRLGGRRIPESDWISIYRDLERLDPTWDHCLDMLDVRRAAPKHLHSALTRFCEYMLYRHLPGALEDDDLPGRAAFCVLSTRMLAALCAAKEDCTLTDCLEFARMYSAEIEYSEDNIAALLDALWEENDGDFA